MTSQYSALSSFINRLCCLQLQHFDVDEIDGIGCVGEALLPRLVCAHLVGLGTNEL